jgi:hypothetical protein
MQSMKLLKKLSSLLQDGSGDGTWSTTRFTFLFTVIVSNVVIFGVWVAICYHRRDIVAIPSQIVTIYSLANGIAATSKIVQKRFETNSTDDTDDSEPAAPVAPAAPSQPVGDA